MCSFFVAAHRDVRERPGAVSRGGGCRTFIAAKAAPTDKGAYSAFRRLADNCLVSRLPVSADDVYRFRDEYVRNRNLIGWNFYNPRNLTEQVDIVIAYDLKGKRVNTVDTADGPVRILSRDALVRMKRASGRPQDLEDARALEELK